MSEIRPLLHEELAAARRLGRQDVPTTEADYLTLMRRVRAHGMAGVIDTLLPGIVGLCAPVFDALGHMALGVVVLGSGATLDTALDAAPASALRAMTERMSSDLGYRGS